MWLLEGLGYVRQLSTGEPMPVAITGASIHANTVLWVFGAAILGGLQVLSLGWRGAFAVLGASGSPRWKIAW